MEEFEPFHWYINGQGTRRFLVTLLFFGLSLLLIIFLFLRFIRMHASFPSTNDDVIVVSTRQNIGRREMMTGGNNVSVVAPAAAPSSEVIKSLPIFMHNCRLSSENTTRFRDDGDECCICLGVFEDGEMIKVMPNCLHAFHSHCIDRWLSSSSTCPVCRSSIHSTSAFF